MFRKLRILLIAMVALLALAIPSGVALALLAVGPIDPLSIPPGQTATTAGFPDWYQDEQGTKVALFPIDPVVNLPDPVFPENAYSQLLGFGSESFYYIATADLSTDAGFGFIEFAVEAAFASVFGDAQIGQEITFTRTRIRMNVAETGTYSFTTPYGPRSFDVDFVLNGPQPEINFTEDIGMIPRDFVTPTTGPITRYLWQSPPPPGGTLVGDGVTLGPVTFGAGGPPLTTCRLHFTNRHAHFQCLGYQPIKAQFDAVCLLA